MYQTLNTIPQPPSSLNPAVPDMLNFIIAKALAKDLDARYQNAKDFANDLRACRDAMPRSTGVDSLDISMPLGAAHLSDATHVVIDAEDESKKILTMGLSPSFDSAGATMRLAAMTVSETEVEELSKTFKMARPSVEAINRAAPQPKVFAKPSPSARPAPEPQASRGGGFLLMAIIALILIGLISAALF